MPGTPQRALVRPERACAAERGRLVQQLRGQGIRSEAVLSAIENVPRHLFIEPALMPRAYEDRALPISCGQTISQPYIVALMTQALLGGRQRLPRVLEIGTGSGYQTAVLAQVADLVYSMEVVEALQARAQSLLRYLDVENVFYSLGNGHAGWPEHAPFDGILVTAAARNVPEPLREQLADGGRMVIPVGEQRAVQKLFRISRDQDFFSQQLLSGVHFVPLVESGR